MNFIKKIVDGNVDNSVHLQFQKFSKGEFYDRALIKAKHTKEKYTIITTHEFTNEFVKKLAEKLGGEKTLVTGAIITTENLDINFKEKKQFQGVKKYILEKEMSGNEILDLLGEYPKAFFALTFDTSDSKLKIKPKAPKSGKPKSKGGEKPKPNFCKITTTDTSIGQSFVFESSDFKQADIEHTFDITELIIPKDETDYAKIREIAKRKGRIIRHAFIDGKETTREIQFTA